MMKKVVEAWDEGSLADFGQMVRASVPEVLQEACLSVFRFPHKRLFLVLDAGGDWAVDAVVVRARGKHWFCSVDAQKGSTRPGCRHLRAVSSGLIPESDQLEREDTDDAAFEYLGILPRPPSLTEDIRRTFRTAAKVAFQVADDSSSSPEVVVLSSDEMRETEDIPVCNPKL